MLDIPVKRFFRRTVKTGTLEVVYATGEVSVASQHTFRTCGNPSTAFTPQGKILRLVEPPMASNTGGTTPPTTGTPVNIWHYY